MDALTGNVIFLAFMAAAAFGLPLLLKYTNLVSQQAIAVFQGAVLAYAVIFGVILPLSEWLANSF